MRAEGNHCDHALVVTLNKQLSNRSEIVAARVFPTRRSLRFQWGYNPAEAVSNGDVLGSRRS